MSMCLYMFVPKTCRCDIKKSQYNRRYIILIYICTCCIFVINVICTECILIYVNICINVLYVILITHDIHFNGKKKEKKNRKNINIRMDIYVQTKCVNVYH